MQHSRLWMPLTVFLAASASTAAHSSNSVYSAAGELPSQRMERLAEERSADEVQRLLERAAEENRQQREELLAAGPPVPKSQASSHPPLPNQESSGSTPARPTQPDEHRTSAAPLPAASATSEASSPIAASPAKVEHDFLAATSDDVTIDVVDMPLKEVVTNLTPSGWKIRFQQVGDEILSSSTDLTATNTTRGEVLHKLLSRAGLAAEPFPEFDTPLLIVSRQGEL